MNIGAAKPAGRGGAFALALFVPLALAQGPAAQGSAGEDADVPTVVVAPDDPLEASDRKLAKLIEGLPGAEHPVAAERSFGEKVGDWYAARRDPNDLSPDAQKRIQQTLQGGAFAPK